MRNLQGNILFRDSSSTVSRSNWNSKVLVFVDGGKLENPEKTLRPVSEQHHWMSQIRTCQTFLDIVAWIAFKLNFENDKMTKEDKKGWVIGVVSRHNDLAIVQFMSRNHCFKLRYTQNTILVLLICRMTLKLRLYGLLITPKMKITTSQNTLQEGSLLANIIWSRRLYRPCCSQPWRWLHQFSQWILEIQHLHLQDSPNGLSRVQRASFPHLLYFVRLCL